MAHPCRASKAADLHPGGQCGPTCALCLRAPLDGNFTHPQSTISNWEAVCAGTTLIGTTLIGTSCLCWPCTKRLVRNKENTYPPSPSPLNTQICSIKVCDSPGRTRLPLQTLSFRQTPNEQQPQCVASTMVCATGRRSVGSVKYNLLQTLPAGKAFVSKWWQQSLSNRAQQASAKMIYFVRIAEYKTQLAMIEVDGHKSTDHQIQVLRNTHCGKCAPGTVIASAATHLLDRGAVLLTTLQGQLKELDEHKTAKGLQQQNNGCHRGSCPSHNSPG